MKTPELDFCIDALRGSLMLTKQAIQVEIAVAFVVFSALGNCKIPAKKVLRQIYASAGKIDCLKHDAPSYETVTRRMSRCADFYEVVTARKVKKALTGKAEQEAIDAIIRLIEPYHIETMDDLAEAAGKPRKTQAEAPGTIHIKTDHVKLNIPPDTPAEELRDLAAKLIELADAKNHHPRSRKSREPAMLHH